MRGRGGGEGGGRWLWWDVDDAEGKVGAWPGDAVGLED